jgi:hypothetical protein
LHMVSTAFIAMHVSTIIFALTAVFNSCTCTIHCLNMEERHASDVIQVEPTRSSFRDALDESSKCDCSVVQTDTDHDIEDSPMEDKRNDLDWTHHESCLLSQLSRVVVV